MIIVVIIFMETAEPVEDCAVNSVNSVDTIFVAYSQLSGVCESDWWYEYIILIYRGYMKTSAAEVVRAYRVIINNNIITVRGGWVC